MDLNEENLIPDPENFKILVSKKLIEFERLKHQRIRISTNFRFSGDIVIYPRVVQFSPIGIGRNATNMIVEFMDRPYGIYADDPIGFSKQKNNWTSFKCFLNNLTSQLGVNKYLYINDGYFQEVQDLAWDGGTVEEMIDTSKKLVDQCESTEQFINKHTWIRDDGIRNIHGNVWFTRENGELRK